MGNDTLIFVMLGTIAIVYQAVVTFLVVRCRFLSPGSGQFSAF